MYHYIPLVFGKTICLGYYAINEVGPNNRNSADGWITSFGSNGKQNWNGSMYGNLSLQPLVHTPPLCRVLEYPGIIGFFGLRIKLEFLYDDYFYLGVAAKIAASPKCPT